MSDRRADFVASQGRYLDDIFSLTDGEGEARARFEELALDTHDGLAAAGGHPWVPAYHVDPPSAWNWLTTRWEHHLIALELLQRWQQWKTEYPALLARNPKLELHDALSDCSEAYDASSWPTGWEDKIFDWVASGVCADCPFEDCVGIVDAAFFADLRRLHAAVPGWLKWSQVAGRVVHVSPAEWSAIRSRRAAEREECRRRADEQAARDPEFARMLARVWRTRSRPSEN